MNLRAPTAAAVAVLGAVFGLAGCSGDDQAARPAPRASAVPESSLAERFLPEISLPADALTNLVPAPAEVPAGMVPLLTSTGKRDLAAVAAYSADPAAAAKALSEHRFQNAYVAQYADPNGPKVLSVVVSRFADAAGADADLTGDLAASSGELLDLAHLGEASQSRRQALPDGSGGELLTLRFRQGRTTWLLAYGDRPRAEPQVALALGRLLVDRARTTP